MTENGVFGWCWGFLSQFLVEKFQPSWIWATFFFAIFQVTAGVQHRAVIYTTSPIPINYVFPPGRTMLIRKFELFSFFFHTLFALNRVKTFAAKWFCWIAKKRMDQDE